MRTGSKLAHACGCKSDPSATLLGNGEFLVRQPTYWELYDHTARAVKAVNARPRIGGPATAQAAWADAFIQHCVEGNVAVDFLSTHVYGNDKAEDVFGTHENIPRNQMVCRAVKKVHEQYWLPPSLNSR